MKELRTLHIASILVLGFIFFAGPVAASVWIGTGTESLLGGDLTDPDDSVKEREPNNYGADKSEEELRPLNGNWRTMISAPTSPPGTPPHQRHPYQSWQGSPACAIFLNNPETSTSATPPTAPAARYESITATRPRSSPPSLLPTWRRDSRDENWGKSPPAWAPRGSRKPISRCPPRHTRGSGS